MSEKTPKVSVIIPTYNRPDYLKEAIDSVLNQTYQDFEIIVVDDGSPNNQQNIKIIDSFGTDKICYYYKRNEAHPGKTRNYGIKRAKGEYIAFLDDDDIWCPKKLEKQIPILNNNKNIMLVCSDKKTFPIRKKNMELELKRSIIVSLKRVIKENLVFTSTVVLKKTVINKIGLFSENIVLKTCQDYEYWIRILSNCERSVFVLNEVLVKYRIHNNNRSHISDSIKNNKKRFLAYKYIFNINSLKASCVHHKLMDLLQKIKYQYYKNKYISRKNILYIFFEPVRISKKLRLLAIICKLKVFRKR